MSVEQFVKGLSLKITDNFHSGEFDCHCPSPDCAVTYIDLDLIHKLQEKREAWNSPIHITSGSRCTQHNHQIGGKKGSYHLLGKAADIKVDGMTPKQMAKDCEDFGGLGRYTTFIHVDIRGNKSRWIG